MLRGMGSDEGKIVPKDWVIESIKAEIEIETPPRRRRILETIGMAAVGKIPWIGGVIVAGAAYASGQSGVKREDLLREWLGEHYMKLRLLQSTLQEMATRLEGFGEEVEKRILSEDYLQLVRKTFSEWDQADTDEKRRILVQLITNAAGTRICSDDIIRLFLDWIDMYHEAHFAVIRAIYERRSEPPTRYDIWVAIYGAQLPRDDSAEADLYKMLIRDLSTGGVIRQPRETDYIGRYKAKSRGGPRQASSGTMKSAFDTNEEYVLTELGSQFVHYTMTELVPRIGGETGKAVSDSTPNSGSGT
jgi:hypothetical protein